MAKTIIEKKTKVKLSKMSESDQVRALAALIKSQPTIFQKEPKLIEILEFDDQQEGNVTTLANRQTKRLTEELSKNKRRTQDLLDNARHYDQLTNKIYDIIYELLSCHDIDRIVDIITDKSPDLFTVDFVEFKSTLIPKKLPKKSNSNKYFDKKFDANHDYQHVMERLSQGKCLCSDRFPASVLEFFFNQQGNETKSVAFIPLIGKDQNPKNAFGILAYGSKDRNKFSSGLRGTVHLERIGKIVALSIERIQAA